MLGLSIEARLDATSPPLDLGGNKQQRVLAALLLAKGNVVSKDRLIDAVWGDRPPAKPNVTLRSYISHLRRMLEPDRDAGKRSLAISTRAPGYAIEVTADQVDTWQFEQEITDANDALVDGRHTAARALAQRALDRWTTPDLRAGVLESFDAEIQHLDDLRRLGRHVVHESMLRSGQHAESLPSLEEAVRSDPFDEGARRQLMLALYRSGRQADALASFTDARVQLREELGLEPSPALRDLEHQILANDPRLQWSPGADQGVDRRRRRRARSIETDAAEPIVDSPAPVGRRREADELIAALDRCRDSSSGGLWIVTGEPGIGKSTLLRHSAEAARRRGFEVSVGRSHDGSSGSTFFPWIAAWRPLVERLDDDELELVVGPMGSWMAQILPELAERLGLEPEQSSDRFTLFEAVARALRAGSRLSPICFVLEDLHWADENSLRLLAVLTESLVDCPVLVLASWRDTEVVSPEVEALLDDVSTKSLGSFRLVGLDSAAIAELLSAEDDGASFDAAQLESRTGGNPLFLGELVRSKQLTGRLASSDTVRSAINSRLRRLPAGAAASLAVGALCLDGFTESMIADVLGLAEDDVLDQMEAALAARLIEEDPNHANRFRFAHDLFAETLIEGLSRPRRARHHTRLALALESSGAPVGELAHHFLHGSGDEAAVKGGEYAHQAAMAAAALFDYESAQRLLEAGLEVVQRVDDDALHADLLLSLTTVKKHTSPPQEVHAVAERAFEVARRFGDVRRMARVAIAFEGSSGVTEADGDPTWLGYWCPPGVIIPMIEQCLEKLPADDPYVPVLWAALGFQYFGDFEDVPAADRAFAAAVETARSQGYPPQLSLALHRRHDALQRELGVPERKALLDESLANADGEQHPMQMVAVRRARALLALDQRDLAGARTELASARSWAESSGRASAQMNAEVGELALLLLQGHLDQVEERLDEAFVKYERFGDVMLDQFGLQLSALWRERHRHAEILDLLDFKIAGYPGPAFSAPYAAILTEMNRFDEAAALVAGFTPAEQTSGGEPILQFLTSSFFAEVAANLDDPVLAARLLPVISPAVGRIVSVYDGILLLSSGGLFAGRLHLTLGNLDEASALFDDADTHHRALDAHPGLARISLARADLAVRRDDRAAVGRSIEAAERWSARSRQRWLIDRWIDAHPGWV